MTILVLAEDYDLTVDQVVIELARRDVSVVRADLSWFPQRMSVAAEFADGRWSGTLTVPDRTVRLEELRSIWYRRPTSFVFPDELSGPERRHADGEARLGLGGVLASLPVLWVNPPGREADASYKPAQLTLAARCGLRVPGTLVTNDPDAVRGFAGRVGGDVVCKVFGANLLFEASQATVAYTRRLTEIEDLSGVETTAHQFQEFVDKNYDVRLTAVGDRLFAAVVDAQNEAARVDWRADSDAYRLRPIEVPPPVAEGVRAFLAATGLCFGAFDFTVDHTGMWWFLECNPCGQFGWVEQATGLEVTSALADLLSRGTP